MSKTFVRSGNIFYISDPSSKEHMEKLPAGNYLARQNDLTKQYFLERIDPFKVPQRIYGDLQKITKRILGTYRQRQANTGVMLSGEKGSGKTLLGKLISVEASKLGIPTIIVAEPHHGDDFNKFIQFISQECIIFFDEFEKFYSMDKQSKLLTLLDGVFNTRKLFLFTCNYECLVDVNMKNRPGRIYYSFSFVGMSADEIREYCNENVKDKEQIEGVVRVSQMFKIFNFDLLKAIVEEMNRYDETPIEAMKFLNAKPEHDSNDTHDITLLVDGKKMENIYDDEYKGNPLNMFNFTVEQYFEDENGDSETPENVKHEFNVGDLKTMDVNRGEYIFVRGNKTLRLHRKRIPHFDLAYGYSKVGTY